MRTLDPNLGKVKFARVMGKMDVRYPYFHYKFCRSGPSNLAAIQYIDEQMSANRHLQILPDCPDRPTKQTSTRCGCGIVIVVITFSVICHQSARC